jgi:DNA polymerase I
MTDVPANTTGGGGEFAARFCEIWCADFEFRADPGEHPWPVCMVAQEVRTGKVIRLWRNELLALSHAPFDVGRGALFCAYFSSAEFSCFLPRMAAPSQCP